MTKNPVVLIYICMAPKSKNARSKSTGWPYKYHNDREILPVKLQPSNRMAARYRDDEFSVIVDQLGNPIPYGSLPQQSWS